jgi:hypothetical protein
MVRRLLVGLLAAGLLLIGAPASAQPPVTETIIEKNVVFTFVMPLPTSCPPDGLLYTITLTTNRVTHITTFPLSPCRWPTRACRPTPARSPCTMAPSNKMARS